MFDNYDCLLTRMYFVCIYKLGVVLFFLVGSEKKTKLSLRMEVGASDSVEADRPHGCSRLNLIY